MNSVNMATNFFLLIVSASIIQPSLSANYRYTSSISNSSLFTADLFRQISKTKTNENVIISPLSVQIALAMVYLGSEGETATQLVYGLRLPSHSKDEVGRAFNAILNARIGDVQLTIANRLFVSPAYRLRPNFNQHAGGYLNSQVELVNFNQSRMAIRRINTWVERKTNSKISNFLHSGSVSGSTSAIIVNAIYFNGRWQIPFNRDQTRERPFWLSQTKSLIIQTMQFTDQLLEYAEFPELDATAIVLPYKASDITMVIILPNERDGLANLERKLSSIPIDRLSSRFREQDVSGSIPKFRIEFTIGLIDILKKLGIRSIFEDTANLSAIFEASPRTKISDVQHKAFMVIDESGTEDGVATYPDVIQMSNRNSRSKYFLADHPFVFVIKSPETVYFIGHVATF